MKELTTELINELLGIKESYQASDKLMSILFNKEEREKLFRSFLNQNWDMTIDWFHIYFQDEHADRAKHKQDFTPQSISNLLVKMSENENDITCGTRLVSVKDMSFVDDSIDKYDRNVRLAIKKF